jgi:predicted nucleic acid-binding protein
VTLAYLDTSAALKLVIEEAESAVLADTVSTGRRLVASWLLHTEMHCAAGRHPDDVDIVAVQQVLDTLDLVDLTRGDMIAAGTHAPLRSNDAIHLAVAIRLGSDEIVTYDAELAAAARAAGLAVVAPPPLRFASRVADWSGNVRTGAVGTGR